MMKTKLSLVAAIVSLCAMGAALLTPHYAAAAELNCSVLPADFCKAATNDVSGKATSKNSAVYMVLEWAIAILTGGVAIVAIGAFVWAGVTYSSAGGSAEMVKKAKDIITQTVIGLAVFAALALFVTWLIPGGIF